MKRILAIMLVVGVCGSSFGDWTAPIDVAELNTQYTDKYPFLTTDGLTLYFCRMDTDTFYYTRIYQATRVVPYGPFSSVAEVSELNYSGGHVSSPWVSPDNLRMYYVRTESGSYWRMKFSERASVSDLWPAGINVSELNALGHITRPRLTADELIIVFHSTDVSGGLGGNDIWMATRADRYSTFSNVRNLSEINTSDNDTDGFLSPDGLTLYFASDRNGLYQIFKATRSSLAEVFGNVEHLDIFDNYSISISPAISSDGTEFYFAARNPLDESLDIYVSYQRESNLVAHWTFDEGAGDTAYDSAGSNDGTLVGDTDWVDGRIGTHALDFDGVGNYIEVPSNDDLLLGLNGSISAWVRPRRLHMASIVNKKGRSGGGNKSENYWLMFGSVENCAVVLGDGANYAYAAESTDQFTVDEWYHVVGTWNSSQLAVYVNGTVRDVQPNPLSYVVSSNTYPLRIGYDSRAGWYFDGVIDDVRIYDRALTASEVLALYGGQPPVEPKLVGLEIEGPDEIAEESSAQYIAIAQYDDGSEEDVTELADWSVEPGDYAFSDGNGVVVTERLVYPREDIAVYASYGEDANVFDAEKPVLIYAVCSVIRGLEFDGVDDLVQIFKEVPFDFEGTESFSIFAWVQLDDALNNCAVVGKEPDSGAFRGYELRMGYGGVRAILRHNWRYPEDQIVVDSTNKLVNGQWHHVGFTYDGSSKASGVTVYVDGAAENPVVVSDNLTGSILNDLPVTIGSRTGGNEQLDGMMKDVCIFHRVLPSDEVYTLMHMGYSDDTELVGYWSFDEGEGQVAHDLSGNGNDAYLGTDPDANDDADPVWFESDIPCTVEQMFGRNLVEAMDLDSEALELLSAAMARKHANKEMLDDIEGLKQRQKALVKVALDSAIRFEMFSRTAIRMSLQKLKMVLRILGWEIGDEPEPTVPESNGNGGNGLGPNGPRSAPR